MKSIFSMLLVVFSLTGSSLAYASDSSYQTWEAINNAYKSGNISVLRKFSGDENVLVKTYAMATIHRSKFEWDDSMRSLSRCLDEEASSAADKYFHLLCLVSYAAVNGQIGNTKVLHYYNDDLRCKYLENNKQELIGYLGATNVGSMRNGCRDNLDLSKWPDTSYRPIGGWQSIDTPGGFVITTIDGVKVSFMVDTGTGNITLSTKTARSLGLLRKMRYMGLSEHILDGGPGVDGQVYLARHFMLGPLQAENVYVVVADKVRDAVGINVLARLGHFELGSDVIQNTSDQEGGQCEVMRLDQENLSSPLSTPVIQLDTAVGALNMILDTGFRTAHMRPVSVFLFPDVASRLRRSGAITFGESGDGVYSDQNGRVQSGSASYFSLKMRGGSGANLIGIVDFSRYASLSYVSGTVGYNLLSKMNVYMDFRSHRLCVAPK